MSEPFDPFVSEPAARTRWQRVLQEPSWQEPLSELAATASYPVYAWWRRSGLEAPEAQTATLACFTRWLTDARPSENQPGAARMREWLSLQLNALAGESLHLPDAAAIEIDGERAEQRYDEEPPGDPDAIFGRRWALTMLEAVVTTMRTEYTAQGEAALFADLLPFAGFEATGEEHYADAAVRSGRTIGGMHKAVFEFRKRQRELLHGLAADTLLDPTDADSELTAYLVACDAPGPEAAAAPLPSVLGKVRPDEMLARAMQSVHMTGGGAQGWQAPTVEEASRLFPQYEIVSLLGRGGMGAVYKGRQPALDRFVAIKLLPLEVSEDRDFADRFRREARAMARLNHPNIVSVFDFGTTTEGHLYFVMEFVEGANLHEMIRGPGLSPQQTLEIIMGVCDALHYAHGEGVVHRDIKPANVMVNLRGQVKVADFGLARLTDAGADQSGNTMTGIVMGTPDYMAPEQKRGLHVDHRADIYSLGVMLYEMLCREVPQGIFDPPSVRVGVDSRLDQVVIKSMQQQPERRYQSTREMRTDVQAVHTPLPVAPEPVAPLPKTVVPPPPPLKPPSPGKGPLPPKPPLPAGDAPPRQPTPPETLASTPAAKSKAPLLAIAVVVIALLAAGAFFILPKLKPGASSGSETPATQLPGASTGAAGGSGSAPLVKATMDSPFVNSLGMKFVPVPILGGPTDKQPVLFSVWDTRVQDYEVFAKETKRAWPKVNFEQGPAHPAVNVSWEDATAFCQWLTTRDQAAGRLPAEWRYRLPSDHEWSCAAGIGDREDAAKLPAEKNGKINDFPWGNAWPPPAGSGNYAGEEFKRTQAEGKYKDNVDVPIAGYDDGFVETSPVGAFKANRFGLYDLGGDVWQACEDWVDKNQKLRVLRGGSWNSGDRAHLLSSYRLSGAAVTRNNGNGFRCVVAPVAAPPAAPASSAATPPVAKPAAVEAESFLSKATTTAPLVNSLGMKFAPVPILSGPTAGQKVLFGVWDVRVVDYAVYAAANPKVNGEWKMQKKDGVPVSQGLNDPVVAVNREEAKAFCEWLTQKEQAEGKLPPGVRYRLPSDEEWSWAAGMPPEEGATPAQKNRKNSVDFPWGKDYPPTRKVGNYEDESYHAKSPEGNWLKGYDDGFVTTSPVGSFPANAYGLYDMSGNVWQWCEDWFDASHTKGVVRGASWYHLGRGDLLSSARQEPGPTAHYDYYGFRCVLSAASPTIGTVSVAPSPAKATAPADPAAEAFLAKPTKASPLVNTLQMKFVPVPISGGPSAGQKVLFGVWDVRVRDYAAFVAANPKVDDSWKTQKWLSIPVSRGLDDPVVGVSWDDAQAFCQWLTQKEQAAGKLPKGVSYRLPTDEEWSWAAGLPAELGATPAEKSGQNSVDFPWGKDFPPPAKAGNYRDESFHAKFPPTKNEKDGKIENADWLKGYEDGFAMTSPVGSFPANDYGLYDMGGNVWQMCEDWIDRKQKERVMRGGAFDLFERNKMFSSSRSRTPPYWRDPIRGFRCVLSLATAADSSKAPASAPAPATAAVASPSSPPPASATKDKPFTNALGMQFVPVPILGGPTGGQRVLFSVWDTRVQDYEVFAKETKREWPKASFPQGATHPAVMVSWDDATAFCQWLTARDRTAGRLPVEWSYRLPTDYEWSCAVGIGDREDPAKLPSEKAGKIVDVYPWGTQWPPPAGVGNYRGEEWKTGELEKSQNKTQWIAGYRDDFINTSPVGSFAANPLGLYDLGGEVLQWGADWFDASQNRRMSLGSAWDDSNSVNLRSSYRTGASPGDRFGFRGFRCVLAPAAAPEAAKTGVTAADPGKSSKEAPFTNGLGMKFVPVPIVGGPTDKQPVLFSVWDTRVQDYEVFAQETKRAWPKADFEQGPTHPAVNVSWDDATAFCQWLTTREQAAGRLPADWRYRLPSDHEWSCAAELGAKEDATKLPSEKGGKIVDVYPWGTVWPPPAGAGNYAGEELRPALAAGQHKEITGVIAGYNDGFVETSPVGSFKPNRFGLYDLGGNVWQWCEDWLDKEHRVLRGAAWDGSDRRPLLSSNRDHGAPAYRFKVHGFRCVAAPVAAASAAPSEIP